jgi:tetratricopeptide (TPR) repeat protein
MKIFFSQYAGKVMRISALVTVLLATVLSALGQSSNPQLPQPSLTAAQDLLHQGKNTEAFAILQQLATAQPPVKGVQHVLGVAYYRTGKLVEAQKAFDIAIKEDPSDLESVQMEGLTLYRLGRPTEAIPFLARVHQWMPNANADSNYVLGLCYMTSGKYDDARRAFATGFSVDSESASAYLILASMLMNADLPEFAAQQASRAVQLSPSLPLAHFLLGEVYLFKSDIEHATVEFEQERRINPGYAATYDRLGDVYTRTGKLQEAQESLTKAISLDRSSTGPFIQMGKVLLRRNDSQTAILYLKHAEKMDPGNFITHTLLAQAYRKLGQEDQAKQETDLASRIHSDNELKLQPVQ